MRIVSPLLKRVVYPSLSTLGVFRALSTTGLAAVTYHGVLPRRYLSSDPALDGNLVTTEKLRQQLRFFKSNYDVISPEDALAWRDGTLRLPPKAVLVTCDDGLLNNLTDMLPVLQQESVRCLFFVTGASTGDERKTLWYEDLYLLLIGATGNRLRISSEHIVVDEELRSRDQQRAVWWNLVRRLSQVGPAARESFLQEMRTQLRVESERNFSDDTAASCRRFGLMTRSELRTLASAEMTIGAHTMNHPMLSQAFADIAQSEITESGSNLEEALQTKVWAFAYPFGDAQSVTPQVLAMPQAAGYKAAFLNYGGGLGSELPPFALPRIHMTAEMSLAEVDAQVSGFYLRLRRAIGRGA